MKELEDVHKIKHHFTVAYSPWVNGSVENYMKHILIANRCLQSEMKHWAEDWRIVTGMMHTSLNEASLPHLGPRCDGNFRTRLEVMTGIKPAENMLQRSHFDEAQYQVKNMEKERAMPMLDIESMQGAFVEMHKDVVEKTLKNPRAKYGATIRRRT